MGHQLMDTPLRRFDLDRNLRGPPRGHDGEVEVLAGQRSPARSDPVGPRLRVDGRVAVDRRQSEIRDRRGIRFIPAERRAERLDP